MKTRKRKIRISVAGNYSLIFLMGIVAAGLVLSSTCFAMEAQFEWSISEGFRYFSVGLDDDGDGLADNFNYLTDPRFADTLNQIQHNYDWVIDFDACTSTGTITKYTWTYETFNRATSKYETKTLETSDCKAQLSFGKEGTYRVTLTVTDAGNNTASITKPVVVQDWLIVAAGDSGISGEGNPDAPSEMWTAYQNFLATISPMTIAELYEKRNDPAYKPLWQTYMNLDYPTDPGWTDKLCHRSQNSAWVLAGKDINSCDNKTSVTFVHLGCSGCMVEHGLIGPFQGTEKLGNFDYEYCDTHSDCIPPQIEQARQLVGSREIDALLTTIGANDIYSFLMFLNLIFWPQSDVGRGSGPVSAYTVVQKLCNNLPYTFQSDCSTSVYGFYLLYRELLKPAVQIFNENIGNLPGYYQELDDAIKSTLNIPTDRIYMAEGADLTRDESGNYCCSEPVPPGINNPLIMIPLISLNEMTWADTTLIQGVNSIIHDNTAKGWNVIGGIYDDFYGHGICSADPYVGRWFETYLLQGSLTGMMHENAAGQEVSRTRIAASLREHFYFNGDCQQGIQLHPQQPPMADPGGPYSVAVGASITLGNNSIDWNNDPINYLWTLDMNPPGSATLDDPTAKNPVLTGIAEGTGTLTLTASNAKGSTSKSTNVTIVLPVTTTTIQTTTTTIIEPPVSSTTTTVNDSDGDGAPDAMDNCPNKPNGTLLGTCMPGSDKAGSTCSSDADCVIGCSTNGKCSLNQEDTDADGIGDVCDNCPTTCNPQQLDANGNSIGDLCDPNPKCGGGCTQPACEQACGI
jgi:PKD repeat protein